MRLDTLVAMTDAQWPPPVMATAELRALFGVSGTRVAQLTNEPDFPPVYAQLTVGRIWETTAVLDWAAARGRATYDTPPVGGRRGPHTSNRD